MENLTSIDVTKLDSTSVGVGGVFGIFMGMGVMSIIISIVVAVLTIIAMWRIFTKAGEAGWKSIIPIYNCYILFKICWETKFFWMIFLAALVSSILTAIVPAVGGVITIIATIFEAVIAIILQVKLAKAFGKSTGFAVGLVLLNTVFTLILGLGSSTYVGKDGSSEANA